MRPWQNIRAGKDWLYKIAISNFMYHTLRAPTSPACHQDFISRANTRSICFFICCSFVSNSVTLWTVACQASLSITNSQHLLRLSPLSQSCHPAISPSVVPLSFCLQSFPASGSFPMSQFFRSDGQSIGASASVLPVNIQD